jgi:hypothetical protein
MLRLLSLFIFFKVEVKEFVLKTEVRFFCTGTHWSERTENRIIVHKFVQPVVMIRDNQYIE